MYTSQGSDDGRPSSNNGVKLGGNEEGRPDNVNAKGKPCPNEDGTPDAVNRSGSNFPGMNKGNVIDPKKGR